MKVLKRKNRTPSPEFKNYRVKPTKRRVWKEKPISLDEKGESLARSPHMVDGAISPPWLPGVTEKIRACCEIFLQVGEFYGFDSQGYSLEGSVRHYAAICSKRYPTFWVSLFKYKIAAFFAFHMGQPIPATPIPGDKDRPEIILGGRFYRWVRFLQRGDAPFFLSFLTSMLYSKKGCPEVDKELISQSEDEAVQKLFKRIPSYVDEDHKDEVIRQIKRTAGEMFHFDSYPLMMKDLLDINFPSTSANYIKSRAGLGCVGVFKEQFDLDGALPFVEELDYQGFRTQLRDIYNVDLQSTHDLYGEFYLRCLIRAYHEPKDIQPLGLAEPLKVRVITKCPPYSQFVLKPLQKFMWRRLRSHPAFELVGTPITLDILHKRFGINNALKWKYLSGDYKDASNEIFSYASEAALDQILFGIFEGSDIPAPIQDLLRDISFKALTRFTYLDEGGKSRLNQVHGQLMGSIMSFPILCIVNAALCRRAFEESTSRRVSLRDCPLLVNGDDCLFLADDKIHNYWHEHAKFYGLTPSIGKTYYSDEFVNINSTTFTIRWLYPFGNRFQFELVQYVNMGLLTGKKRSSVGSRELSLDTVYDKFSSFSHISFEIKRLTPDFLFERVYKMYLKKVSNLMKQHQLVLPYFVPKEFGGLGLYPYAPFVNQQDFMFCECITSDDIDVGLLRTEAPWKIHNLVLRRIPTTTRVPSECSKFDDIYKFLCFRAFVESPLEEMYETPASKMLYILRRNQKVWNRLYQRKNYPQRPFNPWDHIEELNDVPLCGLMSFSECDHSRSFLSFAEYLYECSFRDLSKVAYWYDFEKDSDFSASSKKPVRFEHDLGDLKF